MNINMTLDDTLLHAGLIYRCTHCFDAVKEEPASCHLCRFFSAKRRRPHIFTLRQCSVGLVRMGRIRRIDCRGVCDHKWTTIYIHLSLYVSHILKRKNDSFFLVIVHTWEKCETLLFHINTDPLHHSYENVLKPHAWIVQFFHFSIKCNWIPH